MCFICFGMQAVALGLVSRQQPGRYGSSRRDAVQARPGHAYLQDGQQS